MEGGCFFELLVTTEKTTGCSQHCCSTLLEPYLWSALLVAWCTIYKVQLENNFKIHMHISEYLISTVIRTAHI